MSEISTSQLQRRSLLLQRLTSHGQEHLLRFADALDSESFRKLAEDIEEVDFEQLSQIVALSLAPASSSTPSQPIPLPQTSMLRSRDLSSEKRSELFSSGLALIAQSRVALVILAGGQGTRLGTEDPKGCYDIGLPSHAPLFQLQTSRTLKLSALAGGGCVPVYIMTSPMTHGATVKFFEDNAFFGCDRWG
jgi:UDP-N-acetylglucosamine/UDP-N-acetylgalactosamine diphosphorylase